MVFDLHNDLFTSDLSPAQQAQTLRATRDTVVYAFWTTEMHTPMNVIRSSLRSHDASPALFAVEDLGFADRADLQDLCALRPLYCGLTHNYANGLAGGALASGTLTAFGKTAVRLLNDARIAIDGAHLNRESFYKAADCADRLIVSHTGWETFCSHPRNLTDEQARIVLERGGIIGLAAVRDFIGGNDVQTYIRLIDSFVQTFGAKGVCIGTDFYGTRPLEGLRGYEDFTAVADGLSSRGYTQEDIDAILFQNAMMYFHSKE